MTDGQPRLGDELAEVTKGMVSLHRSVAAGPRVELFVLEPHEAD